MWSLNDWRLSFSVVGLVGVLLFCMPSFTWFLRAPAGEGFSELYILGPARVAEDQPFNVGAGQSYALFLGVGNHMSGPVYYMACVKLRNETEALPNATSDVASSLPVLYEYRVFLTDDATWEGTLNLSLADVTFGMSGATIGAVSFNGAVSQVNKMVAWDENRTGYYFEVFTELWMYNRASDSFAYDNRFVGLWMNLTVGF